MRNLFVMPLLGLLSLECASAQMSPAQLAAFRTANNGASAITEIQTELIIAGSASVLIFTWFGWVCAHAYRGWASQKIKTAEAGSQVLRALFVFIMVLFVVTI